ncbi:MAG: GNAT family N-acetyltransferase [Candidatus Hydrogenedentes bacterium]|nr:GNAT family N-acetyltransferase [Candidatus Hydrogenedentota bacterium]
MGLKPRPVDLEQDRELVLLLHSMGNYESDTPWSRRMPFERYDARWRRTPQPETFLRDFAQSLEDARTVACIWETETGEGVGFLWVTFTEFDGYAVTAAEIRDVELVPSWRGQGFGSEMVRCAEERARASGAGVIRSETGIENRASQRAHEKLGFVTYRVAYEKVLDPALEEADD